MDPTYHPFKALTPNLYGVDFFVGDIHGAFDRLALALEAVGFNPSVDRLICAGDLVDRGHHNDAAVEWLKQPFFHSVRGNHESIYLKWYGLRHHRDSQRHFEQDYYFKNGGEWVQRVSAADHDRLAEQLEQLPYFLSVSAPDGRTVGVVHAELPDGMGWPRLICSPPDQDLLKTMTWGRERLKQARRQARNLPLTSPLPQDGNVIPGLAALVCGHFTVSKPRRLGNILYLDTGGWTDSGSFSVLRLNDILQGATGP